MVGRRGNVLSVKRRPIEELQEKRRKVMSEEKKGLLKWELRGFVNDEAEMLG
jgi:hypothetical protein